MGGLASVRGVALTGGAHHAGGVEASVAALVGGVDGCDSATSPRDRELRVFFSFFGWSKSGSVEQLGLKILQPLRLVIFRTVSVRYTHASLVKRASTHVHSSTVRSIFSTFKT